MEGTVTRPSRLLPLRVVAGVVVAARLSGLAHAVIGRHELLADHPGLSPRLLAAMIAATFVGTLGLAFLGFARQRFGLWAFLLCGALELALETWAGFSPLVMLRIPVATLLVFLAARAAWRELR